MYKKVCDANIVCGYHVFIRLYNRAYINTGPVVAAWYSTFYDKVKKGGRTLGSDVTLKLQVVCLNFMPDYAQSAGLGPQSNYGKIRTC